SVALAEPPTVARIEDDEDGSSPRFYTKAGVPIAMPTAARRARYGPSPIADLSSMAALGASSSVDSNPSRWIHSFILSPASTSERMARIGRQFGRRAGTVRGLAQYLRDDAAGRHELLVDETMGAPVEANRVEGGKLVSHTRFSYDRSV